MKINKHFHTKHGQNTSTQNRSIVSQWHSRTHTQACANDCLTKYSSLLVEWQHKTTTACIHGIHSSDDPQQTWKEPHWLKDLWLSKTHVVFFQLHNFRYVKGDQSIEKESSTIVALFFNEIPHLPINTEPLLYHHHHYQLNHSTKYYYQHSFVRQFPPLLIAETWTVIINIYHHVTVLDINYNSNNNI